MNLEDYIKSLDPELQERIRACSSTEELLALAKEAEVPVPDEALEAIAGGEASDVNCTKPKCPKCGSTDVIVEADASGIGYFHCNACRYDWF